MATVNLSGIFNEHQRNLIIDVLAKVVKIKTEYRCSGPDAVQHLLSKFYSGDWNVIASHVITLRAGLRRVFWSYRHRVPSNWSSECDDMRDKLTGVYNSLLQRSSSPVCIQCSTYKQHKCTYWDSRTLPSTKACNYFDVAAPFPIVMAMFN